MITSVTENIFNGWPILLSVAAPFILALAFVGKYMIDKVDRCEERERALYNKIITDLLSAVNAGTTAINSNATSMGSLLDFVGDFKDDLRVERELRIRVEERLKVDDQLRRDRGASTQG